MGIEVPQGKSVNLLLDILTQPANGPLHHDVEQIRLQPTEQRRTDEQQQHDHQDLADCVEIDSGSGHNGHAGHHVRELTLPRGTQSLDSLFLCSARLELLADDAVEDQVGGVSQDLRSDRGKYDACGHQSEDQDDDRLVGLKRPRRRLSEGPKFMAFFVGSPPPGGPMGGEEVGRLLMMRPVRLAERRRFRRRWDN